MERLDYPLMTLYAELVERLTAEAALGIPSAGSLVSKAVKGGTYWYQQVRLAGKRLQLYLGTDSLPVSDWRGHLAERERLCAMLVAGGMAAPERRLASLMGLLDAIGLFRAHGVVVGSNAFALYGNMLGLRWERALVHTVDVDIARDVAAPVPGRAQTRDQLLRVGFLEVPELDSRLPSTSFILKQGGVRIDFLTPMRVKGRSGPVLLAGLGVHATALRFLDYLIETPVQGAVLTRYGVLVRVPQPARFALHKLIVASRRSPTEEAKRQKDAWQAESLITALLDRRPDDLRQAWAALPWQRQARSGLKMVKAQVREGLLEMVGG